MREHDPARSPSGLAAVLLVAFMSPLLGAAPLPDLPTTGPATDTLPASRPQPSQQAGPTSQPAFGANTWQQNPDIKILGLTPHEMLWSCIAAIALLNIIAGLVVALAFVRAHRESKKA
jgi:hypothetical protein